MLKTNIAIIYKEGDDLNFLFVTYQFPPEIGGTKTRIKNYIKNLVAMRFGVSVIVLSLIKTFTVENYIGATLYRCPFSVGHLLKVFVTGIRIVRNQRIDIIHIFTGAHIPVGLLFLLYGKIKRLKTGISLFGTEIQRARKNPIEYRFLKIALLLADRIGVNSEATSKMLPRSILFKTRILYPGIDPLAKYEMSKQTRIEMTRKEKKVLFVGRLSVVKGLDDLLRAFKLVLGKVPNARLIIVGEGPMKAMLLNLAKELKIEDRIDFTGMLIGKELFMKYGECDVFVMPSKRTKDGVFETFGMVFLEAALLKKPSIGTWSGGIPEAVIHEQTGLLVPENDIKALADAILMLLSNEDLAAKLGERGYQRVMERFTWQKVTNDLVKMYAE